MHKRRKRSNRGNAARLEMTPMIDVVFLLLVFFVVTVKPTDLLAKLDVSRPTAPSDVTTPIPLLRIDVGENGYVVHGQRVTLATLRKRLSRIYATSPRATMVIASTDEAAHSLLIKLLNMCAAEHITNISLMSL